MLYRAGHVVSILIDVLQGVRSQALARVKQGIVSFLQDGDFNTSKLL